MRENCLEQFDTHWNCLELNNQVYALSGNSQFSLTKLIRSSFHRNILRAENLSGP